MLLDRDEPRVAVRASCRNVTPGTIAGTARCGPRLRLTAVAVTATCLIVVAPVFGSSGGGTITTIAGRTAPGYPGGFSGDGGPATSAQLSTPADLAVDKNGNVYIADFGNDRIRKVTPGGRITTFAGTGKHGFSGDGGPATSARLYLSNLGNPCQSGLAVDSHENVYIADAGNHRVRKVAPNGTISTVAGNGGEAVASGVEPTEGGSATSSELSIPCSVAADARGRLYVADYGLEKVYEVSGGTIRTFAGTGLGQVGSSGSGIAATSAGIEPTGVAADLHGNIFISSVPEGPGDSLVLRVSSSGRLTTVAGSRTQGSAAVSRDHVTATSEVLSIRGMAADGSGNIYITDVSARTHPRVREVSPTGIITTIAGSRNKPNYTSAAGFVQANGDGGPATSALLCSPSGVAADARGNVYITDCQRVRKVSRSH